MLIWRRDISQNSRNGEGSREAGRAWFRLVVFKGAILNPKKGCAAGLWQYTMVYRRIWMGSSDRGLFHLSTRLFLEVCLILILLLACACVRLLLEWGAFSRLATIGKILALDNLKCHRRIMINGHSICLADVASVDHLMLDGPSSLELC